MRLRSMRRAPRVDYLKLAGGTKVPAVRRARRGRRAVVKPTKALSTVVRKLVQRNSETKNQVRMLSNYALYDFPITTADWLYPLPSLTQGTLENQRVGDSVRPKALIVKVHVAFNSQIGGFKTIKCRIHVVKHKKFTSQPTLLANMPSESAQLLSVGDGSLTSYDGTIENGQYQLNTDVWTSVKTLNFTLSKDASAPTQPAPFREFTIRIPCPKVLKYESGSIYPENFCPALALGACYVDGTGPAIAPTTPIMMFAQSYFTYTDA